MKNADLARRRSDAISTGIGVQTQIYVDRALNSEVWDIEGNRYIDFAAGIAVVNTGHCHPRVMAAVTEQLSRFTHTCHQVLPYENYVRLAERLNAAVPGHWPKKTVFVTTGAEAIENAIKVARIATGRNAVIAFGGAFHGRTMLGMSLTGKVDPYKKGHQVAGVVDPTTGERLSAFRRRCALKPLRKFDQMPPNRRPPK